ncbi:MAG TPA: ChbG/HpnK family deacetylase [Patescibacteria group bacterium]|nr:ChbG/HpnK family deacetylase [Patescibacteria group bacterium]
MNDPSSPRRLVICADDYGISPAVSLGIRQLIEAGRLSATGAMTCMPSWVAEAPALLSLAERVDVGLHFTLTDQQPLGSVPSLVAGGRFLPIGGLLRRSLSGQISTAEVAAEFDRQLDAFEAAFGRSPDFIDGHQHVHLLPGVRQVVLSAFGRRLDPARCWLRDCTDAPAKLLARGAAAKAGFIAALGLRLRWMARRRGIALNRGFSGFYDPARQTLAERFTSLLRGAGDGHLLMVHPGHVDAALTAIDSLTTPRQVEWDFLGGAALPKVLAEHGFVIAGRGAVSR